MSFSRSASFDLMESCPISRSSSLLSSLPGFSLDIPGPTPAPTPSLSNQNKPANSAPYICDSVSSPLSPLMIQTDYVSETTDADYDTSEIEKNREPKESSPNPEEVFSPLVKFSDSDNEDEANDTLTTASDDDRTSNDMNFYIRPDIVERHTSVQYTMEQETDLQIEMDESIHPQAEEEEEKTNDSTSDIEIDIQYLPVNGEILGDTPSNPLQSSLTLKSQQLILKNFRSITPQVPEEPLDPLVIGPDYYPPNIGDAFQCLNIPDVLGPAERRIRELRNRTFDPVLLYQPPPNPEEVYSSSQYSKMIKSLKEINPNIPLDSLHEIYFQNGYDEFATISFAVKNQKSLVFNTKRKCITCNVKQLTEKIGMKEFGKDFLQIQKLIKTKSLEEVMTYYFYWKSMYSTDFQQRLDENSPSVRMIRKGRAKLILERLQRDGKVAPLSRFTIDTDSDWLKHELYPYIPDIEGAYIHVKDRAHMRDNSRRALRKRSLPISSPTPSKYQKIA